MSWPGVEPRPPRWEASTLERAPLGGNHELQWRQLAAQVHEERHGKRVRIIEL
jgi:hypothetical protein